MSIKRCVWRKINDLSWRKWLTLLAAAAAIAVALIYLTPVLASADFVAAGLSALVSIGIPHWAAAVLIAINGTLLAQLIRIIKSCIDEKKARES